MGFMKPLVNAGFAGLVPEALSIFGKSNPSPYFDRPPAMPNTGVQAASAPPTSKAASTLYSKQPVGIFG